MAKGFARIGSRVITTKGMGIVIRGSQNVIVESIPASRVGDLVILPKGMGIIVQGSPTVLMNSRPAGRLLDRTIPPGFIITTATKTFTK